MAQIKKFIPIDYESFDFEGKNYVRIFGRDASGKKVCAIDSCEIFLWVILKKNSSEEEIKNLVEKIKKIKLDANGRNTKVEKIEIHEKNFLDNPVKALKVFATNHKDISEVASAIGESEIIEKRRGHDLNYITHYISEKKIYPLKSYSLDGEILNNSNEFGGIDSSLNVDFCIKINSYEKNPDEDFSPKTLAYDIETDELKIGAGEILMISLYGKNYKKVLTWKSEKKYEDVEKVNDEKELLEKFCEEIKKYSPDFLVGYFSDGFDFPYIKARAEKLKIKLPLGIDGTQPRISKGRESRAKISGIVHIDLLKFVRTAYSQYMKSETLSLNEVSKEFLNDEKKEMKFKHSSQITEKEWEKYFEYNLHDAYLTYNLFEKFYPDISEFSKVIGEPPYEITRAGLSKYTENYILHNLERFNEIPEKRPSHQEIGFRKSLGGVKGAFVYEPTPGMYEGIAMFDFTSMHTSIIITHNISKSTLLKEKEKNSFESPEIGEEKQKYYFSKNPGFIPELLKEIFSLRKKYKEEYKKDSNQMTKARSNAFKVLSASAHGYIGFFGARYYSHEASATILALVRKYNKEVMQVIEKEGYQVIYGDTDSVAFLTKDKTEKEIKELLKKINDSLPGVMYLEIDGFFKRGIWVSTRQGTTGAKKKYALIDKNGELKIRGFETVRRDWCPLSRELQNKVLEKVLNEGNEEKSIEYVKTVIEKIKKREIELEKLIIKSQLKKPLLEYKAISPHVVAAKKMIEGGKQVNQGELISYYVAEGKGKLVRDKVKLPDEKGEYNIEYYLEKQILPALENIFQVFNIKIKEIINKKNQTSLFDY